MEIFQSDYQLLRLVPVSDELFPDFDELAALIMVVRHNNQVGKLHDNDMHVDEDV